MSRLVFDKSRVADTTYILETSRDRRTLAMAKEDLNQTKLKVLWIELVELFL